MTSRDVLESTLDRTLDQTHFEGLGERFPGKVRDSYVRDGQRVIVVTDRVSAFDVVLGTIPFKGQVLNGIARYWFEAAADIAPHHLISVPDPNVSVVEECEVFPIEMIVRAYLTGSSPTSIWTAYARGERQYCGHTLPDGLTRHQRLAEPIVTPTTKAEAGEHDELTSRDELIARGVVSAAQYDELAAMSLRLFDFGARQAAERGLILVDTKYELGRRKRDGKVIFVDEIHTPDSSRYWYRDGYDEAVAAGESPRALDKEFLRKRLVERGYQGQGEAPALEDALRIEVAERYIELYERVTGQTFEANTEEPVARIKRNLGL
ncbi:MAG: phosphoribosylaminoimidazolesuccinocarboxamide synthase [Myxococcales bacterium]|nr:phosphoribosylaminoimidazolesuccinocarboxamide synthase [Myxococcales bacterium]